MKMQPIKFVNCYNNDYCRFQNSNALRGFEPFTADNGERVLERRVIFEPTRWQNGVAAVFSIEEDYYLPITESRVGEKRTRKLDYFWAYDHDSFQDHYDLVLHLTSLIEGEVKGRTAEDMANRIFMHFINEHPMFEKYLPDVVDFWKNEKRRYEADKAKRAKD